jgi:hypothetical protein
MNEYVAEGFTFHPDFSEAFYEAVNFDNDAFGIGRVDESALWMCF